tara:strand:+ start:769 stop:993 length:225 start_codon:yes stop_codon:yes gene_type:complete
MHPYLKIGLISCIVFVTGGVFLINEFNISEKLKYSYGACESLYRYGYDSWTKDRVRNCKKDARTTARKEGWYYQ